MFTSRRDNGANVCGQEPEDDVAVDNINDDRNHMEMTVQPQVNDSEVQGHIDPGNNRIHRINTGKKFDKNSRPDLSNNINCAIYENPLNEKTDGANRNTIAEMTVQPQVNDSEVQGHIDPGNNRIHRINTGKKFDKNSRPDLSNNINCAIYENPLNEKTDGANRNTIAKEKHSPFPNTKRGAEENDDGCGASGVNRPVQCTDDVNPKDV